MPARVGNVTGVEEDWRAQRARAVEAHAAAYARREAVESAQAAELVADFARRARERGLTSTRLTARSYHGRGRYRTRLRGWYLNPARTLAVGEDGQFYLMEASGGFWAWLVGVDVSPSPPRLATGVGARDGESVPLRTLLERRLAAGDDWPAPLL